MKQARCFQFKQWMKSNDGSTAIEFALLSMPFFILIIAIFELSIMFASASLLEGATDRASRLVRTGQLQQSGGDAEAAFKDALCSYATVLIDCNDIIMESQLMDSFGDFDSMQAQYDDDGNFESQGFDTGGSNDRVLIRTAVNYEMMIPLVGHLLAGSDNKIQFISTIVLQTEPYEFSVN